MNGKLALWSHYRCCDAASHAARPPLRRISSLTLIYVAYSNACCRCDSLITFFQNNTRSYACNLLLYRITTRRCWITDVERIFETLTINSDLSYIVELTRVYSAYVFRRMEHDNRKSVFFYSFLMHCTLNLYIRILRRLCVYLLYLYVLFTVNLAALKYEILEICIHDNRRTC